MKILSRGEDGKAIVELSEKELYLVAPTDERGMKDCRAGVDLDLSETYRVANKVAVNVDIVHWRLERAAEAIRDLKDVL